MDIRNTKAVLALGLTGAMSAGAAMAKVPDSHYVPAGNSIVSVSSPNLRVTIYDGIATLIGAAESFAEAQAAEEEILDVQGVEHVINLIIWE